MGLIPGKTSKVYRIKRREYLVWPEQRIAIEVMCDETTGDAFVPEYRTLDM
jgi:hypothetical protein